MKSPYRLILLAVLFLGFGCRVEAAETPERMWDNLLDITSKFSWYPRQDLQNLLKLKSEEYGQSLEEYRTELLQEVTGGRPPTPRIRPDQFETGLPWRQYYRLSLAEFCLFLATDREEHLLNAQSALSVLEQKTDQPEIEFWSHLYRTHQAALSKDRDAFIALTYHLWRNIILRFETESLVFSSEATRAGFVRNLPYMYENLAHLVIRKAILEQEIPDLYPLVPLVLDIQRKLTVENGYKPMVDQIVERMHGVNSDNRNLNFAVALLEATAKRYEFEDEKDASLLPSKYNLARRYLLLAYDWADTEKGRTVILTQHMGFLNYVVRRLNDPSDPVASNPFFRNIPVMANDQIEKMVPFFHRLAAPALSSEGKGLADGFEDREVYLQAMHQFLDSFAKLSIVLSGFYKADRSQEGADIFPAARPLEQYCELFDRYARINSVILPDSAYFMAAYAARELGELYRESARYSIDNHADDLAFAYQMQAAEIFPLDLPGILQMAFQCSLNGQVQDYFRHSSSLAARLRVSHGAATWSARNPTEFNSIVELVPVVVPGVVDNAFTLLGHVPGEATEDVLFTRAVSMARVIENGQSSNPHDKTEETLAAIGRGQPGEMLLPFYELKSQLFGAPDSPIHTFIRTLYNEVPYENHQYVALLRDLQ